MAPKSTTNTQKKTLYHSELVTLGPVTVTVGSDVLESKFKKGTFYVVLVIDGTERQYSVENDDCGAFFEGQKGRTFTLVAQGRAEQASLTYVGEAIADPSKPQTPPPQQANKPPARPPANRPPPPPTGATGASKPPQPAEHSQPPAAPVATPPTRPALTPEDYLRKARKHANRVANTWLVAYSASLYAADQIREQFHRESSDAEIQARTSTIVIQLIKDGHHNQMPTGILKLVKEEPHPAADPAPQATSDNDGGTN